MKVVIGAKPFNEQKILAHVIGKLLERKGFEYRVRVSKPALEENLEALLQGKIHTYVEYTGTAYNALLKLPPMAVWDAEEVFKGVRDGFSEIGIEIVARLGFRNDFALAVREKTARELNLRTVSDLAEVSREMVFSCPEPYIARPDGLPRLQKVYGLKFREVKPMTPSEMYTALIEGKTDVITAFTTDSRAEHYPISLLDDDRDVLPPYEAIVIDRNLPEGAKKALTMLENRITTETMRRLNYLVDFGERKEEEVADEFLRSLL